MDEISRTKLIRRQAFELGRAIIEFLEATEPVPQKDFARRPHVYPVDLTKGKLPSDPLHVLTNLTTEHRAEDESIMRAFGSSLPATSTPNPQTRYTPTRSQRGNFVLKEKRPVSSEQDDRWYSLKHESQRYPPNQWQGPLRPQGTGELDSHGLRNNNLNQQDTQHDSGLGFTMNPTSNPEGQNLPPSNLHEVTRGSSKRIMTEVGPNGSTKHTTWMESDVTYSDAGATREKNQRKHADKPQTKSNPSSCPCDKKDLSVPRHVDFMTTSALNSEDERSLDEIVDITLKEFSEMKKSIQGAESTPSNRTSRNRSYKLNKFLARKLVTCEKNLTELQDEIQQILKEMSDIVSTKTTHNDDEHREVEEVLLSSDQILRDSSPENGGRIVKSSFVEKISYHPTPRREGGFEIRTTRRLNLDIGDEDEDDEETTRNREEQQIEENDGSISDEISIVNETETSPEPKLDETHSPENVRILLAGKPTSDTPEILRSSQDE